jgi:hypothetical protein
MQVFSWQQYWWYLIGSALMCWGLGPLYMAWGESGDGREGMKAARMVLTRLATVTGETTFASGAVAALLWIWIGPSIPVLTWIGYGATTGLFIGVYLVCIGRIGTDTGVWKSCTRWRQAFFVFCSFAFLAVLALAQMEVVLGLHWLWHRIT